MFISHQESAYRQVNSGFADRLQTRGRRRAIVGLSILGALLIAIAIHEAGDRMLIVGLATLPFWCSVYLLNLALRGVFELDDTRLDEHQLAIRNHAFKRAHGWGLVAILAVVATAAVFDLGRITTFSVAAFAFLTTVLGPRLVAAWTLEDEDDDD